MFSGNFLIDDTFLYGEGERDFEKYRVDPTVPLMPRLLRARRHPPAARRRHRRARSACRVNRTIATTERREGQVRLRA